MTERRGRHARVKCNNRASEHTTTHNSTKPVGWENGTAVQNAVMPANYRKRGRSRGEARGVVGRTRLGFHTAAGLGPWTRRYRCSQRHTSSDTPLAVQLCWTIDQAGTGSAAIQNTKTHAQVSPPQRRRTTRQRAFAVYRSVNSTTFPQSLVTIRSFSSL